MEWALISPVLFLLTFGTIEIGVIYFTAATLEGEVESATRQIRTGEISSDSDPQNFFRTQVCDSVLFECDNVIIDVRSFPNIADIVLPEIINEDGEETGTQFSQGGTSDFVVARIIYQYEVLTPFLSAIISGAGNRVSIFATSVFRNEPF